jgi:hypothetical protein
MTNSTVIFAVERKGFYKRVTPLRRVKMSVFKYVSGFASIVDIAELQLIRKLETKSSLSGCDRRIVARFHLIECLLASNFKNEIILSKSRESYVVIQVGSVSWSLSHLP